MWLWRAEYIVVFNKSTSKEDIEKEITAVEEAGGQVHQKYTTSLKVRYCAIIAGAR